MCDICGERLISHHLLDEAEGRGVCGLCRAEVPPFAKAAAYGSYDAGLRELIHLLKYDRVRPAAVVLGRMLAEAITVLSGHFGPVPPVVVPVPLHRTKERQRGFNQSEVIAAEALKNVVVSLTMQKNAMVRVRPTESQTGLTRRQRQENMRGAFRVACPELIAGRDVLLVDDVFTTGTTISECARVLRRAGAERVFAATVARVLKGDAIGALTKEDLDNESLTMAAQA